MMDNEILFVSDSSPSEDDRDVPFLDYIRASAEMRSIREMIQAAKLLLELAERRSQPEQYRTEGASVYRYNFSSEVTGQDLFRDGELAELMETVSVLKTRLSAERVFSLGCPQLRSERDVFDEVLLRFSHEIIQSDDAANSSNIFSHHYTLGPGTSGQSEATRINTSSGAESEHQNLVTSNLRPNQLATSENDRSLTSANSSEATHGDPDHEALQALRERLVNSNSTISEAANVFTQLRQLSSNIVSSNDGNGESSVTQTDHSGRQTLHLSEPLVQDFLQNVGELVTLKGSSSTPPVPSAESRGAALVKIFHNLHRCINAVVGSAPALALPPYTSPRQKKRRRSVENEDDSTSESKKSKTSNDNEQNNDKKQDDDDDEEEDSCSICLEPWSTGGDHRVTCLKCGHLFGLSCIMKWVEQAHSCPQCKMAAKKSDIRNIFVRKITAEDTSQRDRAMRLLEEERTARRNVEQKEAMAKKRLDLQMANNETLNVELNQLKAQLANAGRLPCLSSSKPTPSTSFVSSQPSSNKRFHHFQRIQISADGNCRVFDYCTQLGMLVVSQKSSNPLFRGYGVKILTRDFKPLSYQPLHSAAIRDMSFRPGTMDGMLLTCGLDKTIQLTSVTSQVVIQKYTVNNNVWSCTWNTENNNLFYAGMERGIVKEFDIRRTDSSVRDVLNNSGSPITGVQYWNGTGNSESFRGLLISQLQSLLFQEQVNEDQYTTHVLPSLQASLMGVSLHPNGKFLASFRPGVNNSKCHYEICNLMRTDDGTDLSSISSTVQAVWEGSHMQAVISRNALITKPETENDLLAITACHSNNTVNVWDYQRRQDFQTLPCYEKAIDIKPISLNNGNGELLGVLTDKEMVLYKWRE